MTKVELFEHIRKQHVVNNKSVRHIARELHVHRRMVRQALSAAIPPARKQSVRSTNKLTPAIKYLIDAWLQSDRHAPKKQRHTAKRIYTRLTEECGFTGSEHTIRRHVGQRKRILGLTQVAFIPQVHAPGIEAEVDWYEATVNLAGKLTKINFFQMRACHSGREFNMAFFRQTQQAFLQGHVCAFNYFGGVFKSIRYDNLTSAVKKVLSGRKRIETERFITLRSHYLFEAIFCLPGLPGAHEKGGVEGGVGRFRRNHLVPIPCVDSLEALNTALLSYCAQDDLRTIAGKSCSIAEQWQQEQPQLMALPDKLFETDEVVLARVNKKSYVRIKTNDYSVPVRHVGQQVEVRIGCNTLMIYHAGKQIATHQRLVGRYEVSAQLCHYLPLLYRKPGGLSGSVALAQARTTQQWPGIFDTYWQALTHKYGSSDGTRQFIDILWQLQAHALAHIEQAMQQAMDAGSLAIESLQMIIRQHGIPERNVPPLGELGKLSRYEHQAGDVAHYDALLHSGRIH